jgi:hypothetical protein
MGESTLSLVVMVMGKAKRRQLAIFRALQNRREEMLMNRHSPENTWEARAIRAKKI